MKKIFITLLIVSGFYSIASAQNRSNNEFGIDVGYNDAYVTSGNSYSNSAAVDGFNVGLSLDHYFSDSWSLKVKAIYDQKGWGNGYIITNNGNEIDGVNFRLNYITVPVMANWHFGRYRNWYLDFGPYIGFLTSATETADGLDVTNSFNSVDGGIALGIGIKIPISRQAKFFIEYDGQGGVSSILKDTGDGSNIQNLRESFNIGINF